MKVDTIKVNCLAVVSDILKYVLSVAEKRNQLHSLYKNIEAAIYEILRIF